MLFAMLLLAITTNTFGQANPCGYQLNLQSFIFTWNGQTQIQTSSFQLTKNAGANGCNVARVYFTKGQAGSYARKIYNGANTLDYNLYNSPSLITPLKEKTDATNQNEFYKLNFQGQNSLIFSVTAQVVLPNPQTTIVPKGTYADTVNVRVYRNNENSHSLELSLTTSMLVPAEVNISLLDSGSSFDPGDTTQSMNFGTLVQGESQSFDLRVSSNAGYAITLSSENNGNLKHLSQNSLISFALNKSGSPVDLSSSASSPVEIAHVNGITPTSGDLLPIQIIIGNPTNKINGSYQDVIIIQAMSTD
jgi:spore coat protein U-like protein